MTGREIPSSAAADALCREIQGGSIDGRAAPRERRRGSRRLPPLSLLLFVFAGGVFANSLPNGFCLDDHKIIEQNVFVRQLWNLPRFFVSDYWEPFAKGGLYRPVATTSYALNYALGGASPLGFHLANVLLHALASVLVLRVLRRSIEDKLVAAGAAFLFAAHAVHTEVVAGVSGGRPELLAAVFLLLAWLAHLSVREGHRSATAPLCYGLAVLSKESAFTFPGVLLLGDLLLRTERSTPLVRRVVTVFRDDPALYLRYALVASACLGARMLALGSALSAAELRDPLSNPLAELASGWRMINAFWVALRSIGLLLAPLRLSYDYSYDAIPLIVSIDDPRAWLAIGSLGVLATVLVWSYRRAPRVCFALGFFVVTFSLASNVMVPIGTILAERLLYFPSIGFCLLVALAVRWIASAERRIARVAAFGGLVIVLVSAHTTRSVIRNPNWRDDRTLYLHDLAVTPGSAKVQANAGWALLLEEKEPEDALAHFERAIEVWKGGVSKGEGWDNPYKGKVYALIALQRFAEARRAYELLLRYGGPDPGMEQAIASGLRAGRRGGDADQGKR